MDSHNNYSPSGATRNGRASAGGTAYSVSLSVMHETVVGENLCVLGSIPELGSWKEFKCHMVWTAGHVWKTVKPIITSEPAFRYKYALLDGENEESQSLNKWERGIDRWCQCGLLPADTGSTSALKKIHLDDEWEKFTVKFTVFHPIDTPNDRLQVQADDPVDGPQTVDLVKSDQPVQWMDHKYGQLVRPWTGTLKLSNTVSGKDG